MTTIATNKDMMVADSKVTVGRGVSYPTTKIVQVGDIVAGAAGHAGDCTRFLEWAMDGFKPKSRPKFEDLSSDEMIDALVLTPDGLYFFSPGYPGLEKINADFYAIGSGGKAARAAMIMGADPIQAVEIACQVDDYSGLPLTVLKLVVKSGGSKEQST